MSCSRIKRRLSISSERQALPAGWALISELALRAAAETYSTTIDISASQIKIRGITSHAKNWREGLSRIDRNLLPGMHLEHQVSEIGSPDSLERQCISLFRMATRARKIEFPLNAVMLGSSASPLLDELIQIAVDCPDAQIIITGHTDNTGEEAGNLALSQLRADAVAAYMIDRGIMPNRLTAIGSGSSQPLVDKDTRQAHQLNRRIDIEIIFPKR